MFNTNFIAMNFFYLVLIIFVNTFFAQKAKTDSLITFSIDEVNKEYFVKVGDIGNDKSQVVVDIKCYMTYSDYKDKTHSVEILSVKQKINNGGNVFFGGELYEGDYVVTLSYVEKGKRIEKTIKKSVKKS